MKFAPLIKLRENTRDRQQMELVSAESQESALRALAVRLDGELRDPFRSTSSACSKPGIAN